LRPKWSGLWSRGRSKGCSKAGNGIQSQIWKHKRILNIIMYKNLKTFCLAGNNHAII